jgi:hypothetical protein
MTPDIADIIAGELKVSRGTAYDMMREALKEASPVEPVAWQAMVKNEALKEFPLKDMAHDWCVQQKLAGSAYSYWIRPLYTTPPAQPAVPEGWKLVPVEPTKEMWDAVNKLDDQCAGGNYDGKGCSIEQAWDCLLAAAPEKGQP